jgi:hypothetical protein
MKSPNLTMIGQLKPMTDDNKWFSYTESLFDNKSGNKTYEMFSVCSITPDSAAGARLPVEDDKRGPAQQKAKEPVVAQMAIYAFAIIHITTGPPQVTDQEGTFASYNECMNQHDKMMRDPAHLNDASNRWYIGDCKMSYVEVNRQDAFVPKTMVVPKADNGGTEDRLEPSVPRAEDL